MGARQVTTMVSGAGWQMYLGDCMDVLPTIDRVDHTICDPPYSPHVHARSIRRRTLPDVKAQPCRRTRAFDFGFDCLDPAVQTYCAHEFARISRGWTLVFSDTELAASWKSKLTRAGLDWVRFGFWVKDRAMPQISGDRPGSRVEQISIVHQPGKKQWNGGGLGNVWQHPVVLNHPAHKSSRVHTAQKPETLMLELVQLFTNEGEFVLDPFAGSATTGVACLRTGRRFIGVEKDPTYFEICCDRLRAEEGQHSLAAERAGQTTMFGKR